MQIVQRFAAEIAVLLITAAGASLVVPPLRRLGLRLLLAGIVLAIGATYASQLR